MKRTSWLARRLPAPLLVLLLLGALLLLTG